MWTRRACGTGRACRRTNLRSSSPNGSKHGSVTPAVARAARERRKDIVQEVAQFMDLHNNLQAARPVLVAEAPPAVSKPIPSLRLAPAAA